MAPHQITKADFISAATVERLVNHGRKWNVVLGAYSSFSDAESEEAAKADVHRGAVNNALYLNSPDCEGLSNDGMPPIRVLVDYLDLVEKYNVVASIQRVMCIGDLCCDERGSLPAVRMMPQSSDGGLTVEMVPCCENHARAWWDAADWDGRHLEAAI